MQSLLDALSSLEEKDLTYTALGQWVRAFPFRELTYKPHLPQAESKNDYARHILTLDPLEAVLIYWPPGVRSAIHHHEGFYGYVVVLEGMLQDRTFTFRDKVLKEDRVLQAFAGGIIDEPDGVIHELGNIDPEQPAVTLHLYYPALETLEGLRIFDLDNRRIGTLNETAPTASWQNPVDCFTAIEEEAFALAKPASSHRMVLVQPKPDPETIYAMLARYYDEQAHEYDNFDLEHKTRKPYTETINRLIGQDLCRQHAHQVLDVAVGTGRRAVAIRTMAQCDYDITGVDMSREMCHIAGQRGIDARHGRWLDIDLGEEQFDAATFLYAFGHIATSELRLQTLQKIYRHLKPGGRLYLDLFNLHDQSEWGPAALQAFEEQHLERYGYEKGDVFYKKTGGTASAFVHYFTEEGARALLQAAGFTIASIQYIGYVHDAGKIVDDAQKGFFFITAVK